MCLGAGPGVREGGQECGSLPWALPGRAWPGPTRAPRCLRAEGLQRPPDAVSTANTVTDSPDHDWVLGPEAAYREESIMDTSCHSTPRDRILNLTPALPGTSYFLAGLPFASFAITAAPTKIMRIS